MAIHHPTTADNHPVTLWRWRPVYVPGYYYSTGLALLSHYSLNSSLGPFMTTSIPHCLSKAIHHPSALWRWRPGGPCMSRSATTTIEIFNRRHYSLNSSLGNRRSALPFAYALFALVLSSLVSLECTVPLRGLFLAHAEAGLYCTVQSITPPWAGCSGLVHLNQSRRRRYSSAYSSSCSSLEPQPTHLPLPLPPFNPATTQQPYTPPHPTSCPCQQATATLGGGGDQGSPAVTHLHAYFSFSLSFVLAGGVCPSPTKPAENAGTNGNTGR